ncbi:restriction endonuclease subunit S [Chryseobacterium sp. WX]|uniref:restriction endonuclease subunit S n=1 Tax=Chryseobacterium sp. WX TaxID=3031803 RepID=UPI0024097B62|nr:restriction endonuclease subunit S [Chryseobacterium sp. WX]WFB67506.1 restriction endonuclease subunit S [Chryseobacterium sp. WX]
MNREISSMISFTDLVNLNFWSVAFLKEQSNSFKNNFEIIPISKILKRSKNIIQIENELNYKRITVKLYSKGVILRDELKGSEIGVKRQYIATKGQFIMSKIDARNGAFGIVPSCLNGAIVTNDFPIFDINNNLINPSFFFLLTTTNVFIELAKSCSSGTTNRQRIDINKFLNFKIPLPSIDEQQAIVDAYFSKINEATQLEEEVKNIDLEIEKYLFTELGISICNKTENKKGLNVVEFKDILEWGTDKVFSSSGFESKQYKLKPLSKYESLVDDIFRGKSPKYADKSDKYILNQKCNRWNKIEIGFVKTVVPEWYNNIDRKFFTKEGDIIINSTGEGTIGRSSYVGKEFEGFIYDSHILLLRLNKEIMNPELFVELFNSAFGQNQVNQIKSAQATKQTELGVSNLLKIEIPVVNNIAKQDSIIKEIKRLREFALVSTNKLELLIHQASEEFEKAIFQ